MTDQNYPFFFRVLNPAGFQRNLQIMKPFCDGLGLPDYPRKGTRSVSENFFFRTPDSIAAGRKTPSGKNTRKRVPRYAGNRMRDRIERRRAKDPHDDPNGGKNAANRQDCGGKTLFGRIRKKTGFKPPVLFSQDGRPISRRPPPAKAEASASRKEASGQPRQEKWSCRRGTARERAGCRSAK